MFRYMLAAIAALALSVHSLTAGASTLPSDYFTGESPDPLLNYVQEPVGLCPIDGETCHEDFTRLAAQALNSWRWAQTLIGPAFVSEDAAWERREAIREVGDILYFTRLRLIDAYRE